MVAYVGTELQATIRALGTGLAPAWGQAGELALTLQPMGCSLAAGQRTFNLATMYPVHVAGALSRGVDAALYGSIVVLPPSLDLGLVLSAKMFTIGVWNLTGVCQRLLGWSTGDLSGVSITNPDGFPVLYGPGGYRDYLLTVLQEGRAQVDGIVSWTWEGQASSGVAVTGVRLVTWSFKPNWREDPIERLEWATDVMTAQDGTEQRHALRAGPRRSLQALWSLEGGALNLAQSLLWGWQARAFAVPVWTDWQPLGAPLAAGATTISITTTYRDFAAGRLAILWRDYLQWEVVEVASVTPTGLTLRKPTTASWTAVDRIIPVRLGRLAAQVSINRPTGTMGEATLEWSFEVGEAVDATRLGTSPWPLYKDSDVLAVPSNVADYEPVDNYNRVLAVADTSVGAWSVSSPSRGPAVARRHVLSLRGRQQIMDVLAWIDRRKGRAGGFWLPSGGCDLQLVADIGASDANILVRAFGYTKQVALNPGRKHLAFWPSLGDVPQFREITGAVESAGNTETLSLDGAFGVVKRPADFRAISFLTWCRLATDRVEIVWHSDSLATIALDVVEVPL